MKNKVLLWSTSVEKEIATLPFLLFYFFIFIFFFLGLFSFFMASFSLFFSFCPDSHPDLWGNHSLHHPFLTWENALIIKIITLLFTYNSIITTWYLKQNMTLYECLRRCTGMVQWIKSYMYKNNAWWLCHKYDVNYMIMQNNMTMMERVIINGTVESCMAIYLRMAMEMP